MARGRVLRICDDCRRRVQRSEAFTLIEGHHRCADCTYVHEHGPTLVVAPATVQRKPGADQLTLDQ